MPVTTYVENGCLVGYHPPTGLETRVPLREIFVEAGADLDEAELGALDEVAGGDTIVGALAAYAPEIGADLEIGAKKKRKAKRKARRKKIKKGLKKAVKKIAKSKILKGIAKIAAKVVPAPFNAPILAAQGAAKFARALKKKNPKAKKLVTAVRAAAAGKLSAKKLAAQAKKLGVSPKIVTDAAAVKRLAMDAQAGNPRAKAALRLAADVTDTNPIRQQLALAAAAQAQAGPNARAFIVQAPGGQTYRTVVQSG